MHFNGGADSTVDISENDEEAVAFGFEEDAVVIIDDGDEQALGFMDGLEEMDDAEFFDVSRKTREIGKHDTPFFAKEIPNAFVDGFFVRIGFEALLNEFFKAVFGRGCKNFSFETHAVGTGFEPVKGFLPRVFKTRAIGRYANPPSINEVGHKLCLCEPTR